MGEIDDKIGPEWARHISDALRENSTLLYLGIRRSIFFFSSDFLHLIFCCCCFSPNVDVGVIFLFVRACDDV